MRRIPLAMLLVLTVVIVPFDTSASAATHTHSAHPAMTAISLSTATGPRVSIDSPRVTPSWAAARSWLTAPAWVHPRSAVRLPALTPRVVHHVAAKSRVLSTTDVATRDLMRLASSVGLSAGQLRDKWQRVAVCEVNGNWAMVGSSYSGIGFANTTWSANGGPRYATYAGQATRDEQILIATHVTHGWIPDQNGCAVGGW